MKINENEKFTTYAKVRVLSLTEIYKILKQDTKNAKNVLRGAENIQY